MPIKCVRLALIWGAEQLSSIFGIIEESADQQDEEQISNVMGILDEEINKVVAELKRMME